MKKVEMDIIREFGPGSPDGYAALCMTAVAVDGKSYSVLDLKKATGGEPHALRKTVVHLHSQDWIEEGSRDSNDRKRHGAPAQLWRVTQHFLDTAAEVNAKLILDGDAPDEV